MSSSRDGVPVDPEHPGVQGHFDQDKRRCTVYESRPGVCREYPDSPRCGYYEFLEFERAHQDDPEFIALT